MNRQSHFGVRKLEIHLGRIGHRFIIFPNENPVLTCQLIIFLLGLVRKCEKLVALKTVQRSGLYSQIAAPGASNYHPAILLNSCEQHTEVISI